MSLKTGLIGLGAAALGALLVSWLAYQYVPWTEYGPVLHEPATVIETIYTPPASHHRTGYQPTLDHKGRMQMQYQAWTDHTPAVYGVVFRCQHGQFVSQGADDRHKSLWGRLPKYTEVDVTYRELFTVYRDGRREMAGLDFLDAVMTAKKGKAEEDRP